MRYLLWELNVKAHALEDRIVAAIEGGFKAMTLSYRAYRQELSRGLSPEEIRQAFHSHNIEITFLDGITSWTPRRFNRVADPFMESAFDFSAEEGFDMCERIGIRNLVAVAGFAEGEMEPAQQIDYFGTFCDAAAKRGLRVHLEAMPILGAGIPTFMQAAQIVQAADRPNGHLMFDTWHFMRRGADLDHLASLRRGLIQHIQLVDGRLFPKSSDLWSDAMTAREVPGDGDLPLAYFLKLLAQTQDIETIGPESILERLDHAAPGDAGRELGDATRTLAMAAGFTE